MEIKKMTRDEFTLAMMLAQGWKYVTYADEVTPTACYLFSPDDLNSTTDSLKTYDAPPDGLAVYADGAEDTTRFWHLDLWTAWEFLRQIFEAGGEYQLTASQGKKKPHECRVFFFGTDPDAPSQRIIAHAVSIEIAVAVCWYEWKTGIRVELIEDSP